jgi:hypothetical protein
MEFELRAKGKIALTESKFEPGTTVEAYVCTRRLIASRPPARISAHGLGCVKTITHLVILPSEDEFSRFLL